MRRKSRRGCQASNGALTSIREVRARRGDGTSAALEAGMPTFASRLLLSAALVSAAGATALAQPSNTAPSTAPQNANWNDVSNINGQLVPVGEKNNYLYEFKRTNISANPVGWIMGLYGVSASYALDDHLAIRGELDYWSPPDS